MARIAIKNSVLLIDSEQDNVDVSIKPTKDKLRLWGSVGAVNYSVLATDINSVIVVRNKTTDKVWIDKSLSTLPVTYLDRLAVSNYETAVEQIEQRVKP